MSCTWSAENATKAYIRAVKMGKRGKEPDVAEFISALAAGNNAQLMVMAAAGGASGSTSLSLVAAAHQTGGRVEYIVPTLSSFYASKSALGPYKDSVKFVIGNAKALLMKDYKGADFVLIDCNIEDRKGVFSAAQECVKHGISGLVVGYNASHKGSWPCEFKTHFLPIGHGLMVARIGTNFGQVGAEVGRIIRKRSSRWVVKIDELTGEEHVYRVISPQQEIEA